jgi:excisionase family DNA binding protein
MVTSKFRAPQEVAYELGVDVQTVRRWIHNGRLRAFKPGKEYRIREDDLEEFLRAREVRPKTARRSPYEPTFNDVLAEERPAVEISAAAGAAGGSAANLLVGVDRVFDALVADLKSRRASPEEIDRVEDARREIEELVSAS